MPGDSISANTLTRVLGWDWRRAGLERAQPQPTLGCQSPQPPPGTSWWPEEVTPVPSHTHTTQLCDLRPVALLSEPHFTFLQNGAKIISGSCVRISDPTNGRAWHSRWHTAEGQAVPLMCRLGPSPLFHPGTSADRLVFERWSLCVPALLSVACVRGDELLQNSEAFEKFLRCPGQWLRT